MKLPDPYDSEAAQSWQIIDGSMLLKDTNLEADVVIIGSGAGGGVAAEIFSRAGKRVILLDEGPLQSSSSFKLKEFDSYTKLYQEGMTRTTSDHSISILQGRTVGGSTVVNWTSSFRTPHETLDYWQTQWGIKGLSEESLKPWFELLERRLSVHLWETPNANNSVLKRGCELLSLRWAPIPRNVLGCWNLGYCGFGCATNAKQSMLVTTIPAALEHGAILGHRLRAERLIIEKDLVKGLEVTALDQDGNPRRSIKISVKAPLFISAGGAIGSPALLLRSPNIPDPHQQLGKRTFLHPSVFAFGQHPEKVEAYYGAPQSIYSDHFQWRDGVAGPMGYKIEATPMHPLFASALMQSAGSEHRKWILDLPKTSGFLALLRDGFHEESPGGQVVLRSDGSPQLDYPLSSFVMDGAKRALLSMAEILFAGGAEAVHLAHADSSLYTSWADAKESISNFVFAPSRFLLGSAHVMGGCAMGEDPRFAVINSKGQHHQLENLYVCDGSMFPTSVGANPQFSIFALSAKISHEILGASQLYFDQAYIKG